MKKFYDIPGYDGLYKVNVHGDIYSTRNTRNKLRPGVLKQGTTRHGYLYVKPKMNDKLRYLSIHRALAMTFIPNPNNYPCVNHIDGVKTNNSLSNLEWCTHAHNNAHARRTGLNKPVSRYGEDAPNSKLKADDVLIIKNMFEKGGKTFKELGEVFNVHASTISKVVKGINWNAPAYDSIRPM